MKLLRFSTTSLLALVLAGFLLPALGAWPPPESLSREPDPLVVATDEATERSLREALPAVADFLRQQPKWTLRVDPRTSAVERAFGDPLTVAGAEAAASVGEVARLFLESQRALLAPGLDLSPDALVLEEHVTPLPDPESRIVRFRLHKDGLRVLGAGAVLALRDNRVFYLSTSALAPVKTSSTPRLTPEEALAAVTVYAGAAEHSLALVRGAERAFYPTLAVEPGKATLRYHLIYILEVKPEQARAWEGYVAYVDAHDGEVLAFFSEARSLTPCTADPTQAHATIQGGVRPNRADDPEQTLFFPYAHVIVDGHLVSSDANGRYPYVGGAASSTLDGDFFKIHCTSCTNPAQPLASGTDSGLVDFGAGGSSTPAPVVGNGRSTPADRAAYYHLSQARFLLEKWDNAPFGAIDAFVNIDSFCNAFSSGYMVGFFRGGSGCANTGEIRDVMQHEFGHTWDRTDDTAILSFGLSEWKGDLMAILMGGDPCVGESFHDSGGPSATCSGVRDLDEKAPGRTDHPATPAQCPTCATLTAAANGCASETHCLGEISGQATWHLLSNLQNGRDYVSGALLPAGNPGMSAEQARFVLERLMIGGGPLMETWDPAASGVSEYDSIILADDDEDGNLANGTPHAAYINAALSHHGIAENPMIADAADCAPLADPVPSVVVERDAATGLPLVRIDWTPQGGATTFDVYRNTRAGDAFLPLARDVAAGPILDRGVQVGTTLRYFVAAVRKSGCANISPGANVVSVTIAPPELSISAKVLSEAPGASDGDGRIEPGERVRVQITLRETGAAAGATGVTATLSSSSATFAPVVAAGPVSFGNVPAGGTASGSAPFEVMLGPSTACGGTVHLVLSIAGNEGCWLDGLDVPLATAASGCAVTPTAFVEVVPGSPVVTSTGGDADQIADNCETTTVGYQLRNSGGIASGPVAASASTSAAGITFVPRPDCTLATLTPGQTAACQFSFSMGGAPSTGTPFTLVATSAGNAAPSRLDFTLPTENNPRSFSTVVYGFEGGLQGWSTDRFGLSFTHRYSGTLSLHSGSTTSSNVCGVASSPALLLDPASTSTLSMEVYGDIEPFSDSWYDRANVHLIDLDTNQHVLLAPSGFPYNASGDETGGLCHIPGQAGWAGSFTSWQLATFDLAPFRGHRVRIELNYATDDLENYEGIYVDDVTVTNAASATAPADGQSDACGGVPEVSGAGAPLRLRLLSLPGGMLRWTWQDLGPAFQYNLYAGVLGSYYSHGANQIVCQGRGAGVVCDGTTCTLERSVASLPAGKLYFVVTATAYGAEGTSGFASTGSERSPAQNTCAP